MPEPRILSHLDVFAAAREIAAAIDLTAKIYGIPRGGTFAALALKSVQPLLQLVDSPEEADVLVDDVEDSGATAERWMAAHGKPVVALFLRKPEQPFLIFPWETDVRTPGEDIIVRLLQFIGEDPSREGLRETPSRVIRAWKEWGAGYKMDPAAILKTFEDGAGSYDQMVIVNNIPVVSKCEHHLADITGIAHIGYIPNGRVVGLSKLPRIVEVFARRLQVQERLTVQVADALHEHLKPLGVGVLVRAAHACMSSRGVRIHGSVTTTSALRGALLEKPEARQEFMNLCQMAERGKVL